MERIKGFMVTKLQAAIFLGVPPTMLDRFVAEKRLRVYWGGPGNVPFYNESELRKLKQELVKESHSKSQQYSQQTPDLKSFIDGLKAVERILDAVRPLEKSSNPYKRALTIHGASNITGLSASVLRRDIAANKLKAKKIEGKWRIRRADLFAYLRSEWEVS